MLDSLVGKLCIFIFRQRSGLNTICSIILSSLNRCAECGSYTYYFPAIGLFCFCISRKDLNNRSCLFFSIKNEMISTPSVTYTRTIARFKKYFQRIWLYIKLVSNSSIQIWMIRNSPILQFYTMSFHIETSYWWIWWRPHIRVLLGVHDNCKYNSQHKVRLAVEIVNWN